MFINGNLKLKIEVVLKPAKCHGSKYQAMVAGEIVGNGATKQAALDDAVTNMYRGYALHHYKTETPVTSWWSNPANNPVGVVPNA
jgi:hypothetical protein